jgi:predicted phosphodiesterase
MVKADSALSDVKKDMSQLFLIVGHTHRLL